VVVSGDVDTLFLKTRLFNRQMDNQNNIHWSARSLHAKTNFKKRAQYRKFVVFLNTFFTICEVCLRVDSPHFHTLF
jgi:hypothetical protein